MKNVNNENGFVLVLALVVLVMLSIIGITSTSNTYLEMLVSTNDKWQKHAFYKAEAGAVLTAEIVEQNINCESGFTTTGNSGLYTLYSYDADGEIVYDTDGNISKAGDQTVPVTDIGNIRVHGWERTSKDPKLAPNVAEHIYNELALYLNSTPWETTTCNMFLPDRPNISFPINRIGTDIDLDIERTDIYLGGGSVMLPGGNIVQAAGHENIGFGAAGGGTARRYDIISRYRGLLNSEAVVIFGWQHLIGQESACQY